MADGGRSSAWIPVFGVIVAALIGGAVTLWTQRPDSPPPAQRGVPSSDNPQPHYSAGGAAPPVMGQLEVGTNRQGTDLSANEMVTPNAESCAELCRTNDVCKAMTYVISLKTCWLKSGVPPPFPPGGPDYVSAVKQ